MSQVVQVKPKRTMGLWDLTHKSYFVLPKGVAVSVSRNSNGDYSFLDENKVFVVKADQVEVVNGQ